jgi:site-specific DNA-cytosine methylase
MTSGVGSMLIGARVAGFDILGNIEWRKYYHKKDEEGRNTFTENFPGSFFVENMDELDEKELAPTETIDLAMGHPDCGNFSLMSNSRGNTSELNQDPGDIPIFVAGIKRLKPRFFVQDNLPKSLIAHGIEKWAEALPEYDLFPEWICNWRYGNVQKHRKRFFMIGALKTEKFSFSALEEVNNGNVREALYKTPMPDDNNMNHTLEGKTSLGKGVLPHGNPFSWAELQDFTLKTLVDGQGMWYYKVVDGESILKKHIGIHRWLADKHGYVLTGSTSYPLSPFTGLPLSIRARARVQGVPDDFIFYGTKLEPDGTWNCNKNVHMVKQVAKFMPIQFCTFIAKQIADHINGVPGPEESVRLLKPSPYIDEAKQWYCKNVGYSDQEGACRKCWFKGRCDTQNIKLGMSPEIS